MDKGQLVFVGYVLIGLVFWIVCNMPVDPAVDKAKKGRHKATQFSSSNPAPLAKGNKGLVNCGVATKTVPLYKRSAQEMAASVAEARRVVATHVVAEKLRRCSPECKVHTVIAGMVRDRKALKKLKYDQPF